MPLRSALKFIGFIFYFQIGQVMRMSLYFRANSTNVPKQRSPRNRNAPINLRSTVAARQTPFVIRLKSISCRAAGWMVMNSSKAIWSIRRMNRATSACAMINTTIKRAPPTIQAANRSSVALNYINWVTYSWAASQCISTMVSAVHSNSNAVRISFARMLRQFLMFRFCFKQPTKKMWSKLEKVQSLSMSVNTATRYWTLATKLRPLIPAWNARARRRRWLSVRVSLQLKNATESIPVKYSKCAKSKLN